MTLSSVASKHQRPAQVGVAGVVGVAEVEDPLDAGLGPGPLEERPLGGGDLAGEGRRLAGEGEAERTVRRQVGVDQGLVAGLDAVEGVGPHPGRRPRSPPRSRSGWRG